MTDLRNVVRQLQQERVRAAKEVASLDAALAALNGSHGVRGNGRGRLSAAARARIAAAQRARWAKFHSKAQGQATSPMATKSIPQKRTLSAAARKRIAAAQRARWAKFKAGKEKKKAA